MDRTSDIGSQAENAACKLIINAGLDVLERNYRCKLGEIDIIAKDQGTIVFIEVRKRSHYGFGNGFDSVDKRKQLKLIKAALFYLQEYHFFEKYPCRFDIVSASATDQLHWIKDAFQA